MLINKKSETLSRVKKVYDLTLEVNKKIVEIEVINDSSQVYDSDLSYEILLTKTEDNDDIELSSEEIEAIDDFISRNYNN